MSRRMTRRDVRRAVDHVTARINNIQNGQNFVYSVVKIENACKIKKSKYKLSTCSVIHQVKFLKIILTVERSHVATLKNYDKTFFQFPIYAKNLFTFLNHIYGRKMKLFNFADIFSKIIQIKDVIYIKYRYETL